MILYVFFTKYVLQLDKVIRTIGPSEWPNSPVSEHDMCVNLFNDTWVIPDWDRSSSHDHHHPWSRLDGTWEP